MERLWEVDFLRGLSIVFMIVFNWSYALDFLGIYTIFPRSNAFYWDIFPYIIAASFMFIAGISLTLSWNRFKKTGPSRKEKWQKYVLRGAKIFGLGLVITGVTWIAYPEHFIFFGILHLIGISIVFSPLIISNSRKPVALISLVIAVYLASSFIEGSSLISASLGLSSPEFKTFDYFPIIPWSAVIFSGITVGHKLFPNGERRFKIEKPNSRPLNRLIELKQYLGRHSLIIYLLHQIVLILVLLALGYNVL